MNDSNVTQAWWALRLAFGLVPIAAGADKFFNLLASWESYLSPMAARVLPIAPATFMKAVGVIEILVGVLILTRWTRIGAYVASAWLLLIALNLISTGKYFDVAARDVVMAVAAFALARLDEVRVGVASEERRAARRDPLAASV